MLQRVERHIRVKDTNLDYLCFLSKNLYNYINYLIRQEWIVNKGYLDKYKVAKQLAKENQPDFRALPSALAQQVIYQVFSNWRFVYNDT